jgi:hypothetical protein
VLWKKVKDYEVMALERDTDRNAIENHSLLLILSNAGKSQEMTNVFSRGTEPTRGQTEC